MSTCVSRAVGVFFFFFGIIVLDFLQYFELTKDVFNDHDTDDLTIFYRVLILHPDLSHPLQNLPSYLSIFTISSMVFVAS